MVCASHQKEILGTLQTAITSNSSSTSGNDSGGGGGGGGGGGSSSSAATYIVARRVEEIPIEVCFSFSPPNFFAVISVVAFVKYGTIPLYQVAPDSDPRKKKLRNSQKRKKHKKRQKDKQNPNI